MAAAGDMDDLIARFMDVTMCGSRHAAADHLNSCRGSLDEALALYFAAADDDDEPVRPPIPTRTERLYGDDDGYLRAAPLPPPPPPVPVGPPMPIPARTESFFQDAGYLRAVLSNAPGAPTPPVPVAVEATGLEEEEDEYVAEEEDAASECGEAEEGEDACSVRVRFPDGRLVEKEFGTTRPVAELFRYCRRRTGRAFRLVRFAGAASEEIRGGDATFDEMGLHRWTLHLLFRLGPRAHSVGTLNNSEFETTI